MNWRLVSDLVAYVVHRQNGRSEIFFAPAEKKSYQAEVLRKLPDFPYTEIRLDLNEFKIRINKDLAIQVSNPNLPTAHEWYEVRNFNYSRYFNGYVTVGLDGIGNILSQVPNTCGDFGEEIFEVVFSDDTPGEFRLVSPKMKEYNECLEEMKRRINCEIYKKTKKWKPGHRYDSAKETFFYLGELKSRRLDPMSSEFVSDSEEMVTVYLCVNQIPKDAKTITDILREKSFGPGPDELKVLYKLPLMVDSGEVLENDMPEDIRTFWPEILNTGLEKINSTADWAGYYDYSNIKDILDFLSYQSRGHEKYDLAEDMKIDVRNIFKNSILDVIEKNWDIQKGREELNILSGRTEKENVEPVKKMYFHTFKDGNIMRNLYYPRLYQEIFKEDFEDLILEVLKNWDTNNITDNFEDYIRHSEFLKLHWKDSTDLISKQRVKSTNYTLDIVTLEDLFGGGTKFHEYIHKIVSEIRSNYGVGATEYYTSNIGTRQNPKCYETIIVTVRDIIGYYSKKGEKVPEDLKYEIVRRKFWKLSVVIDIDGELK